METSPTAGTSKFLPSSARSFYCFNRCVLWCSVEIIKDVIQHLQPSLFPQCAWDHRPQEEAALLVSQLTEPLNSPVRSLKPVYFVRVLHLFASRRNPKKYPIVNSREGTYIYIAQEADSVRGVCGAHGGHEIAEVRDVRRTRRGRGSRGRAGKGVDGVSPGRPQSFRYRDRPVEDRSSRC